MTPADRERMLAFNARFEAIFAATRHVHGERLAQAASNAFWGQTLVNLASHMARAQHHYITDHVARDAAKAELFEMEQDFSMISQSSHEDVCEYLGVDPADALTAFDGFKQLMFDALTVKKEK